MISRSITLDEATVNVVSILFLPRQLLLERPHISSLRGPVGLLRCWLPCCLELGVQCSLLLLSRFRSNVEMIEESFKNF
jgi:hypothetical protein